MQLTSVVLASAALAAGAIAAQCDADNCLRAAIGTAKGLQSVRLSSCTSFAQCTVTPGATYVYDSNAPTGTRISSSAVTSCPTAVPSTASACSGTERYSSACSCGGVTPTYSSLPSPTVKTPSTYFRIKIENATSPLTAPVIEGAYAAFGSVGESNAEPGIVLIQSPAGTDPNGSGYYRFSSNETADPTFSLGVGQHRSGGPIGTAPGALGSGDALWAYTNTCAAQGGCAAVRCRRVDGPDAATDPNTKYLACVSGINAAWTQTFLCPADYSVEQFWDYLFLGQPGVSYPGCAAIRLRVEQLPGNPYFPDSKRKRDTVATSMWQGQPLFVHDP